MSLTHPSIVHRAREIDRLALLAEAAEDRRAAAALSPSAGRPSLAVTQARRLGAALIAVGNRLQGPQPAGHPRTEAAESGAAS